MTRRRLAGEEFRFHLVACKYESQATQRSTLPALADAASTDSRPAYNVIAIIKKKAWWWVHEVIEKQIEDELKKHNACLIDLDHYKLLN
jgi:hypothetical protein